MKARYQVIDHGTNRCILSFEVDGKRVEREYWCPDGGGYVRQISEGRPGTLGRQICDGLSGSGSTLSWPATRPLAILIRRELRARLRATERAHERAGYYAAITMGDVFS